MGNIKIESNNYMGFELYIGQLNKEQIAIDILNANAQMQRELLDIRNRPLKIIIDGRVKVVNIVKNAVIRDNVRNCRVRNNLYITGTVYNSELIKNKISITNKIDIPDINKSCGESKARVIKVSGDMDIVRIHDSVTIPLMIEIRGYVETCISENDLYVVGSCLAAEVGNKVITTDSTNERKGENKNKLGAKRKGNA